MEELKSGSYPWVSVDQTYYVYLIPNRISNPTNVAKDLHAILQKYGYSADVDRLRVLSVPQEIRYIRLLTNMNVKIAKQVRDAKTEFYNEKKNGIPLLHGV